MTQGRLVTIFLLVSVICLGSAALLLPERGTSGDEGPVGLVSLSPAEIVGIEVTEGGVTRRVAREAADRWVATFPAAGGEVRWPASLTRVRGFLRILDRLTGVADRAAAEGWRTRASARLTSASGGTTVLEIGEGTLGGRSLVRVDGGATYVASDELARLLTGAGLSQWLEARPFAAQPGAVTVVTVRAGDSMLQVSRAGERWMIDAPFATAAESALVEEMVRSLQTLQVSGVEAGAPAGAGGGEAGEGTVIEVYGEQRRGDAGGAVERSTSRFELRTVGREGADGTVAVVASGEVDGGHDVGPVSARVPLESLAGAVRQPAFYIARRAIETGADQVRSLRVETEGASGEWSLEGGVWTGGQGAETAQAPLTKLARLLTETPSAACAWVGPGGLEGARPLGAIECGGLGGARIGRWGFAAAPLPGGDGKTLYAVLVADGVARFYEPESAVEIVQWVVALGSG